MPQLSYPTDTTNAFAGMLADNERNSDILSRQSEDAVAHPHGVAVVVGTDPERQVLLPTGAANLLGVVVHSHAAEVGSDDLNLVNLNDTINVLHEGRIFVELETGSPSVVAMTTGVFVRVANAGAGEGIGRFRGDVDGGDALTVTGARWITSGAAGDVVVLEIDKGATIA